MSEKKRFWKQILNLLFPEHIKCVACGRDLPEVSEYSFCTDCESSLPYSGGNVCARCGVGLPAAGQYCLACKANKKEFDKARAPFKYEGVIPHLIRGFKYDNKKYLTGTFARYIADTYITEGFAADFIVPVPMFSDREWSRGYNQAALLAREVGKRLSLDVLEDKLLRVRDTPPQAELSFKERSKNLSGAFKIDDKTAFKGKKVLIIDDVLTTTATANECARLLRAAGAKEILVLTVARASQKIPFQGNESGEQEKPRKTAN